MYPADAGGAGDPPVNAGKAADPDERRDPVGRFVMPDGWIITVDDSWRYVGRADLRQYTGKESAISRAQFMACRKDGSFVIKNCVPSDAPSGTAQTLLDGKALEGESELKNGMKVTVSDVEAVFKV
ncbi:MAG: hypothetical protein MPK30_02500 [Gammaproteobacteria bacterium]|nr:hypothetical protein [Gammaproteobacteria bacterium]